MAKILFDIPGQETVDWQHCRLVMEVSHQIFSYTVLDAEKQAVRIRFYEMNAENSRDLTEELQEILNDDDIFREAIKEKTIIYNFPECELVPGKYFDLDTNKDLIELLHGDLNTGVILGEEIRGWNKYNVFRVPAGVHQLFRQGFSNGRYWHYYSLWLECGLENLNERVDYLSVIFYPRRILVAAVKNKQLQLLQSFSYEVVEDVAYYLLTICRQLNLPAETTVVELTGMIDASSALYTEIFKYFGHTELDASPAVLPYPIPEEYPAHFFSPLLKLALCVS